MSKWRTSGANERECSQPACCNDDTRRASTAATMVLMTGSMPCVMSVRMTPQTVGRILIQPRVARGHHQSSQHLHDIR